MRTSQPEIRQVASTTSLIERDAAQKPVVSPKRRSDQHPGAAEPANQPFPEPTGMQTSSGAIPCHQMQCEFDA